MNLQPVDEEDAKAVLDSVKTAFAKVVALPEGDLERIARELVSLDGLAELQARLTASGLADEVAHQVAKAVVVARVNVKYDAAMARLQNLPDLEERIRRFMSTPIKGGRTIVGRDY